MLDGNKTFILALAIMAGGFSLILTNRMDALAHYADLAMWVCGLMGIREAGDKGLLKGIVTVNKPSLPEGVKVSPGV